MPSLIPCHNCSPPCTPSQSSLLQLASCAPLMLSIRSYTQELGTMSWSLFANETAVDTSLSHLLKLIEQGIPSLAWDNPSLAPLLYQDRVVVPPSLRRRVLQHLHAAHQGTSTMEQRASTIVYWSGMSKDIRDIREGFAD